MVVVLTTEHNRYIINFYTIEEKFLHENIFFNEDKKKVISKNFKHYLNIN